MINLILAIMKILFFFILFFYIPLFTFSQDDIDSDFMLGAYSQYIDYYCPFYVLNNYCVYNGFDTILYNFNIDERITEMSIVKSEDSKSDFLRIDYAESSIILFEKYKQQKYLGNFFIYFQDAISAEYFFESYSYVLNLTVDSDNPNRAYFPASPMNAIILNNDSEKNIFSVSCFVFCY